MTGTKYRYTSNIANGDEAGQVYWRVLWRLQDDPIASMLAERTLEGLAATVQNWLTSRTDADRVHLVPSMKINLDRLLKATPLTILTPDALEHLHGVIWSALFPANTTSLTVRPEPTPPPQP